MKNIAFALAVAGTLLSSTSVIAQVLDEDDDVLPAILDAIKRDIAPIVSITAPGNGQRFASPATFSITANASDSDGQIRDVAFYLGSTSNPPLCVIRSSTPPYSCAQTNLPNGSYTYIAVATDNLGKKTTSSSVTAIVQTDTAPTVAVSPSDGSSAISVSQVQLTVGDQENNVSQVTLGINGTTVQTWSSVSTYPNPAVLYYNNTFAPGV